MRWDIAEKTRAEIVGFSGINFSGERMEVSIWPHGGLQQGGDIDGTRLKSIGIIAPVGTRLVLITANGDNYETLPWRALQIIEGHTFQAMDGRRVGVQVPDLDRMDPPDVRRIKDPDTVVGYPFAESLEAGRGWTFGRSGGIDLKCNIKRIIVERFDLSKQS